MNFGKLEDAYHKIKFIHDNKHFSNFKSGQNIYMKHSQDYNNTIELAPARFYTKT